MAGSGTDRNTRSLYTVDFAPGLIRPGASCKDFDRFLDTPA